MSSTSLRIGFGLLAVLVLAGGGFAGGWITRYIVHPDAATAAIEPTTSVDPTTTQPFDDEAGMPSATAPQPDPTEPAVTTPAGTRVVGIGQPITSGDITLTVDSADIDACKTSAREPDPGNMWVIVDFTLTNNTGTNAMSGGWAWGLWDDANRKYETDFVGPEDCHPAAEGGPLDGYSTVRYTAYFEVPASVAALQFRYTRASRLLAVSLL